MALRDSEKDPLYQYSREVLEVAGWKMFIFLPQNTIWRFFMIAVIIMKCTYNFTRTIYMKAPYGFFYVDIFCDIMYALDVVLSTMHYCMKQTRKLRHGKKRHPLFQIIDYISFLPLERIYVNTVYNDSEKIERLRYAFNLGGALRMYQIPKNFSDVKDTILTMKNYLIVTIFQVLVYYLVISQFLSCFIFLYFTEKEKEECLDKFLHCAVENIMETFYLLEQCYYEPFMRYPLYEYSMLLIVDIVVGYMLSYGFVIPLLLFVGTKFLEKYYEYSRNLRHVIVLTGNQIKNKKLKKRVLEYFNELWNFGRCDKQPELLDVFPMCFRKNIFCDMHWEAMRHSYILQDVSIGCKRAMSVHMRTEFLLPHTTLFVKNENPSFFLYVESGLLQVMAEENSQAPMLNLSGGTVLGEISFFFHTNAIATVRAERFSIIHTLSFKDFFRVLMDYPSDKRMIFRKVKEKLKLAKNTFVIKTTAHSQIVDEVNNTAKTEEAKRGNIKWIKAQYRAIHDLKKAKRLLDLRQITTDDYERKIRDLDTQIKHTSVYLPYISVDEEGRDKSAAVCLKDFPWLINPNCQFVSVWNGIIHTVTIIVAIFYPAFIGWYPYIPDWFFTASCIISLMYCIDFFLRFSTTISVKNIIVKKFSTVCVHRMTKFPFFIDLAAAIPIQIFKYAKRKRYGSNLYFLNALLKCYRLMPLIYKLNYSSRPLIFVRTTTKYIVFLVFIIYLWASTFYLTGIECLFYKCDAGDWYEILVKQLGQVRPVYCSILKAFYLGYQIPEKDSRTSVRESYIIFWISFFVFHVLYYALKGECTASYILELSYDVEYKRRMDFIYSFMGHHKMSGNVRKRVMSTMHFHWIYYKNNFIFDKSDLWDSLSANLKLQIEKSWMFPTLAKCRLFDLEDEELIMGLCKRATFLAVPKDSVLLTLGIQTSRLYVIQRGFVQINSFIEGDLRLNTSRPIKATTGDAFPVIDVLCQSPSSVTAVTVSDCELLVFELEDILTEMTLHGIFKDLVDAIKETDFSKLATAKLGVSEFKDIFSKGGIPFQKVLNPYGKMRKLLTFLLRTKAIHSHSIYYVCWELSRVLFSLIYVILWPISLCCFHDSPTRLVLFQTLCYSEFFSIIDFYIRLHVAYYNKTGIYVSHTLATAVHYLVTAFIADVIAFSPNVHVLYIIAKKGYVIKWYVIVLHVSLRTFSLYRVVGFIKYMKGYANAFHYTGFIVLFFFVALCLHYYVCFMVFLYTTNLTVPRFHLTVEKLNLNSPFKYYISEVGLIIAIALRSECYIYKYDEFAIAFNSIVSTLGLIGQLWLFSHLTLNSTTSNKSLTTNQYYMQSFINYLMRQSTDEKIVNQAIEHFEHEWRKHLGNRVHTVFGSLPQVLQEDVLYPLYRVTFSGVVCLSGANESFYRILSRSIQETYLKKGSVIIFQKEVQSYIYFIHSGQCMIESSSEVLYRGAMLGDIKGKGIMKSTITALTHVVLLRISSRTFFMLLNNFYVTKRVYMKEVAQVDDYLFSMFTEERDDYSVFLPNKEDVECEFAPLTEDQDYGTGISGEKQSRCSINYNSKKAKVIRFIFMLGAYISVILIPILIATRIFNPIFLAVIYALDVIWLAKIIVVSRMVNMDEEPVRRGKHYKRAAILSKILFHTITVFPFEIIPLLHFGFPPKNRPCFIMCMCYVNRMTRMFYIIIYFKDKGYTLMGNSSRNVLGIILLKIALINFSCCVNIMLKDRDTFKFYECYTSLNSAQHNSLVQNYLCVLNSFIGVGIINCKPQNVEGIAFHLFVAIWALLTKAFFINYVLMIIYISHHNRTNQMVQLEQMAKYLTARDVSPDLRLGAQKYYCNLLNSFSEGADTSFLNSAPSFLRTAIMQNIYLRHLTDCFVFRDLDESFLKQLTTRLYLNIFFPGDYITEKGDVDHNMYFIQEGEVFCIQKDKTYQALERTTDVYTAGRAFGVQQGILSAYPHTQTYRAKTLCNVLVLNYYKWEDLRVAFPNVFQSIYKSCLQSI